MYLTGKGIAPYAW